jgi:hypothetical protein
MSSLIEAGLTIGIAIVGATALSALISKKADTANVVSSLSAGFANALSAATAPVTGQAATPVVTSGSSFGSFGFNNQLPF